ncbi:MAG: hypothetical protein ACK443_09445 [Methylococcaceae bacterium]
MSITLVCGAPGSRFTTVFSLLEAQGLSQPKAVSKGREISMADLHQRLVRGRQPGSPIEVGKAWEQAAGDILLANWDQTHWGWADSRSVWLLDFWYGFDPDIKFVLVHSHPQQVLAQCLEQVDQAEQVLAGLAIWDEHERAMLHFYHRHRDRCMLVDATEVLAHPADFLRYSNSWLGLPDPSDTTTIMPSMAPVPAVDGWLAAQLLEGYPHIEALRQDVNASLSWTIAATELTPPGLGEAIASLIEARQTREQLNGQLSEVNAERHSQFQQNLSLKAAAEKREQQYERARKDVESARRDLLTRLDQRQKKYDELAEGYRQQQLRSRTELEMLERALAEQSEAHAAERERLMQQAERAQEASEQARLSLVQQHEASIRQQAEENELLLLQLHQVQEELESYFLKAQDTHQGLESFERQNAALESQLISLQQQNAELISARDHQSTRVDELQQQIDHKTRLIKDLEQQLHSRQATVPSEALRRLQAEIASLQQSNNDLSQQHEAALRQQTEENELLLLQLHQVQEELEHYFLGNRERDETISELNARWARVLQREPDLCDWSAVDVIKTTHKPPNHLIRWRILDLAIGKRVIPEMEIAVMVREGVPSLVYFRDAEKLTQGPLQRWPASFSNQDKLLIQPEGPEDTQLERSRAIAALSPADWQMTRTLCHLLSSPTVMTIAGVAGVGEDGQQFWQTALKRLRQQLDACPKVWRYGTVSLKRAFSNVDYEHLWLMLDEAEYENRHWHPFQFRLGAIDLQRGGFSAHPKLEFPKQEGQLQQFEGWYPESRDDFGDKFELRLDLTRGVLDEQVWNRLSPADKTQMFMLVATLADMVRAIPHSQRSFARPIEQWISFAEATLRVVEQQILRELNPPAAKPPAVKIPAAETQNSLPEPAATAAVEPVGRQQSGAHTTTTPDRVAENTAPARGAAKAPVITPEAPTAAQRLGHGPKASTNQISRKKTKAKKGRKG